MQIRHNILLGCLIIFIMHVLVVQQIVHHIGEQTSGNGIACCSFVSHGRCDDFTLVSYLYHGKRFDIFANIVLSVAYLLEKQKSVNFDIRCYSLHFVRTVDFEGSMASYGQFPFVIVEVTQIQRFNTVQYGRFFNFGIYDFSLTLLARGKVKSIHPSGYMAMAAFSLPRSNSRPFLAMQSLSAASCLSVQFFPGSRPETI